MAHEKHLGPGTHSITLKVGGLTRRYLVYVPSAYDGLRALPVVLMIHGAGGAPRWALVETGWADKAEREGFLVVFPEGTPPDRSRIAQFLKNPLFWHDGSGRWVSGREKVDDIAFGKTLIEDLRWRFSIDPERIFVTGFSNGAGMTFRLGVELSGVIAAIAPVAGHCWLEDPRPERSLPTVYLIGTEDPLVPLEGGNVDTPWGRDKEKPPVPETLRKWARAIDCPEDPNVIRDEGGIRVVRYGPGRREAELLAYMIEGLGHHWPGGAGQIREAWAGKTSDRLKATDVIWEFFEGHPKESRSGR